MPLEKHNRLLRGRPKLKRQFQHVLDSARDRGADEGSAYAQANAVVKRTSTKKRSKR